MLQQQIAAGGPSHFVGPFFSGANAAFGYLPLRLALQFDVRKLKLVRGKGGFPDKKIPSGRGTGGDFSAFFDWTSWTYIKFLFVQAPHSFQQGIPLRKNLKEIFCCYYSFQHHLLGEIL